jgi:hypothetical protein
MSRPQKYSDSDITAAIQAMVEKGEEINPMRVRMRLGGGNMGRIKAIIGEISNEPSLNASVAPFPDVLLREFQRLSSEASRQVLSVGNKCWTAAWTASASGLREENAALHKRIEDLGRDLSASTDLVAQIKEARDDRERALDTCVREKVELVQNCSSLQSALRNAESDLRAAQRMMDTFERNQRQDRQDIQGLQKRIESLISEIAVLKAKPSESGAQKAFARRKKNN